MGGQSKDDAEAHDRDSLDTDHKTLCKFIDRRAKRTPVRIHTKNSSGRHGGGDPMQIGLVKPEEPRDDEPREGDEYSDDGDDDVNAVGEGRGRGKRVRQWSKRICVFWLQRTRTPQVNLHFGTG